MNQEKSSGKGFDSPINSQDEDRLNRAGFAGQIFNIIEQAHSSQNIRVGINGEWGAGKTSVLNLIKNLCRESEYPIASFNPWHFKNTNEAWRGFAIAVNAGVKEWKRHKYSWYDLRLCLIKFSECTGWLTNYIENDVGKAINKLVLKPLTGLLEQRKDKVQELLNEKLGEKRLYIFMDDLDRANPDILYGFLMFLNEIVNLEKCVFVIAYDEDGAADIIKKKAGIEKGKEFLEKIIHLKFDLPVPSDYDWEHLINQELNTDNKKVKKNVVMELFDYLPKSPRKLKQYLDHLNGLHISYLDRFFDDELHFDIIYISQLIRMEFLGEFIKFFKDVGIFGELSTILVRLHAKRQAGEDKAEIVDLIEPHFKHLKDEEKKARIINLVSVLANRCSLYAAEKIKRNILIADNQELLTWKEYKEIKNDYIALKEEERIENFEAWIKEAKSVKEIEKIRKFMISLMEDRRYIIGKAIEETDQENQKTILEDAEKVSEICNSLLNVKINFEGEKPVFNRFVYKEWCSHIKYYSQFHELIYEKKFQDDKKIALKMTEMIGVSHVSGIYNELLGSRILESGSPSDEGFRPIKNKMSSILELKLAESFFQRFYIEEGIGELMQNQFRAEQGLIFNENSCLYEDAQFKRMGDLASEAKTNSIVWNNFIRLTEMLFTAFNENLHWVNSKQGLEIIKKKDFIDLVWKATTSRHLDRRTVGSLEIQRKKVELVISKSGEDITFIDPPDWWKDLVNQ
jgi:hypothetical protein